MHSNFVPITVCATSSGLNRSPLETEVAPPHPVGNGQRSKGEWGGKVPHGPKQDLGPQNMGKGHPAQATGMRSEWQWIWRPLVNCRPKGPLQPWAFFHLPPLESRDWVLFFPLEGHLTRVSRSLHPGARLKQGTWRPLVDLNGKGTGFKLVRKPPKTELRILEFQKWKEVLRLFSLTSSFTVGTMTKGLRGRVTCLRSYWERTSEPDPSPWCPSRAKVMVWDTKHRRPHFLVSTYPWAQPCPQGTGASPLPVTLSKSYIISILDLPC